MFFGNSFCFMGGYMKDIDKMLKCRALFLQSIATLYGDSIMFDDNLRYLLAGFYNSYIRGNFNKFCLIYCFKIKDGMVVIHEEDEWVESLNRYLNYFLIGDNKNIIKLYDDIGYENVEKISELAEMFYNYIKEMSQSASIIKS